jgi:hypothetical protein
VTAEPTAALREVQNQRHEALRRYGYAHRLALTMGLPSIQRHVDFEHGRLIALADRAVLEEARIARWGWL